MAMRRLIMSAIVVSIVAVTASAADEYDSYVWLSSSDSATSSSFFNNDNKRWVKKDHSGAFVAETQGPHAGEKYYIPGSKILTTPNATGSANSPIEYVFAGDELVVAHRLQLILKRGSGDLSSDYANVKIDNLVLLPNGHIYSASDTPASVSGRCTVKGTKGDPSSWFHGNQNGATVILKSKLCGENNSVFKVRYNSPGKVTLKYLGDASEFYGTMLLDSAYAQLTAATPGGFVFPGTVEMGSGAVFNIPAGNTATVGNLDSDGGVLSIGADNANSLYAKLTVTNSIYLHQKKMTIRYPRAFEMAAEKCELLRVSPDSPATISEKDFQLSDCTVSADPLAACVDSWMPNLSLSVEETEDGSRVLYASHRKSVYYDAIDGEGAASAFFPANSACWSDDSEISPENDYYINGGCYAPNGTYAFGGASLTICETGMINFNKNVQFTVPDFRWVASPNGGMQIKAWNVSSGVRGKVTLPKVEGKRFSVQMWNGGDSKYCFTIASDLYGEGTLGFTSRVDVKNDARAFYRLSGKNSNFAGCIHLFRNAFSGSNKEVFEANPDKYCVTLSVSDSEGLGGAMPAFNQSALLLANHSLLKTEGSLVFDEPTRGWSINGIGRVHVDAGETLVVTNKQITYSGEFRKEGEGLLKLGGTARFTDAALETPLEGTNVLSVAAGSVMPTDVTAFDGLEVRFAAGAKLVLNPLQGGDISKYGMYNVKWDNPVVVAGDAALPVHLSLPENFDKEVKYSFGVITVNPTAAADIDVNDIAVKAPKGTKASVSKEENVDENGVVTSVTYVCTLSRAAFVMVIR